MEKSKSHWFVLSLMLFTVVWGFGNVVNNFANQGLTVVTSWVLILLFYFFPYVLMVGEMGTVFKDKKGGISSWIKETYGVRLAYFAGWTYWVVHIPYLAQKPQNVLVALSWMLYGDGAHIKSVDPLTLQLIVLVVFLAFLWVASRGITSLKVIGAIAGLSMFIMGFLYIFLMLAAPGLIDYESATKVWDTSTLVPKFDFTYFTTISMLVFAVGGCEKLTPYVKEIRNPAKNFSKTMIALGILVGLSALIGSIAMGMMFNTLALPNDLKMNGTYLAFNMLGKSYHISSSLMYIFAVANVLGQLSTMMFSIDAPLKMLIADGDKNFIPKVFRKVNKFGAPINGYKLTAILVGILIIIPALGIGNMNRLYSWLLDLNSIVMPLRYLWVFIAYIALRGLLKNRKLNDHDGYKFIKNDKIALGFGIWCFLFTAFACSMGIFPKHIAAFTQEWFFELSLNIATPIVLIALGLIFPFIARRETRNKI